MRAKNKVKIPQFVKTILERLHVAGYDAYIVGGAVRDMVMRRPVADWDIATSAHHDEIRAVFEDISHFSLKHDTVTLVHKGGHYELTPFRGRDGYGRSVEEDLGFRDFTVNAMAYDAGVARIIDPHGGRDDISRKLVRAVGDARERFLEDPLRLMRAVRVAAEIRFRIEQGTQDVVMDMADQIAGVAKERIRDELMKILLCPRPSRGVQMLRRMGVMDYFLPELLEGYGKHQNPKYHRFTIFRHVLETLDRVEDEPVMRLTALFHDIAKPRVREKIAGKYRFYGHDEEGAELTAQIMGRLKFSNEMVDQVTHLVRHHVIGYHSGWGNGAVRRLIRRVGQENMTRLIAFRRADLLAHGMEDVPMDLLVELENRIAEMNRQPMAVSIHDLAVDGNNVMEVLNLSPGPAVGKILAHLMEKVTDHPQWNTREKLISILEEMKI